jgi:hypothetical protein
LLPPAVVKPEQRKRRVRDAWEDPLTETLSDRTEVRAAACLAALGVPTGRARDSDFKRVTKLLKAMGWRRVHANREGARFVVWQR